MGYGISKIAIDCEMVGDINNHSMMARVSLVDENGRILYDSFCKPKRKVYYYRNPITGITEDDLRNAPSFAKVRSEAIAVISNNIVVGHSIDKDLDVLELRLPSESVVDIAEFPQFKRRNGQKRSLKDLAREFLGIIIQDPYHDSLEDARITMKLYKLHN